MLDQNHRKGHIGTWRASEQVPKDVADNTCNSPPEGVGSESKSPRDEVIVREVIQMRRSLKGVEAAIERLLALLDS